MLGSVDGRAPVFPVDIVSHSLFHSLAKVDDCEKDDVGNYVDFLHFFRNRAGGGSDWATPALLRRSVTGPPYRRASTPPTTQPTNYAHLRGATYAIATNWSTFARSIDLGGDAREVLHLPVHDWHAFAAPIFSALILFRPAKGRVAAMVAGSQRLIDRVKASGMVGAQLEVQLA